MTQVTAINTRQVKKIDGHTIFNIVKTMTGEPADEIMRVIPPKMVPMIGKNDPQTTRWHSHNTHLRVSWDSDQQVSWGNALKHLNEWKRKAGDYNDILLKVGNKQAPPLPKIFTDWVKNNQPIPWTQRERDTSAHEIMVNVLVSNASWNVRSTEKTRLRGLSNKKLEQALFDVASTPLNNAPWSWRNLTTSKQRKEQLAKLVAKEEAGAVQTNLLKAWRDSPEAMSKEMLMYVGGNSPQYMMSWIIANTYQQANPLVKNIASKEGSYQYRVWRLNERYYPSMNANDTLPKTTMNWPRYTSDPKILQVFTLPEIMKSLKSTFSSKQNIMANQQQLAFVKWKAQAEKSRDSLFQGNFEWTMNKILDNGLDYYNENNMNNSYTWYPDYNNQNYNNRKLVKVDPKDQILLSWPFIEKKIGAKKLKSIIDKREVAAKLRYDAITKEAKDHYDRITADIQAARTASTMKGKATKK